LVDIGQYDIHVYHIKRVDLVVLVVCFLMTHYVYNFWSYNVLIFDELMTDE